MGLWDRFKNALRGTVQQASAFDNLTWIEPDNNPYRMHLLDCRAVAQSMVSTTQDPRIAVTFSTLRSSLGEEYVGHLPQTSQPISVDLSYPFDGSRSDGPLFKAARMEDKWDVYGYGNQLYFCRSWTGELQFRSDVEWGTDRVYVKKVHGAMEENIEGASEQVVASVDFLIKSHLYKVVAPHFIPFIFKMMDDEMRNIALHSFSQFGRWGWFASYDDTISLTVEQLREMGDWGRK